MAQPNITFIKGSGGLGRSLPSNDHISGLLFYTGTLPSGFTSGSRVKALYSVADAIAAGINNDYSDATAATMTYEITNAGATGDVVKITVVDLDNTGTTQTTTLCTYTKVAADSSIALLGASIASAINLNTPTHGYTASFTTATLTVTAPKRLGTFLNSGTPYVVTITGTIAGTLVQNVVAGVASLQASWYYHISEFFRMQPKGYLYVGFYAVPSPYTYTEIASMQTFANGEIRQIGIWKDATAYATSDITAIDAVCKGLDDLHMPISAVLGAHLTSVTDISTMTSLATFTNEKVTLCIGQDAGGQGNLLYVASGKSITQLGCLLGTIALSKVSESVAWVGNFNISNGIENEVLGFANGTPFSNASVTTTLLDALNTKRLVFAKKFVGISGSYWNDSHTAVAPSSDYAYIENNRTIDKAIRNLYSAYLPYLNSPIQLNADGTMSDVTVSTLENVGDVALDAMLRDSEISAKAVVIDPAQNVLSTSKLIVAVSLVINGVARYIEVPIGFKPNIS